MLKREAKGCFYLWISVFWMCLIATPALAGDHGRDDRAGKDKMLYVWASDQARVAPDFLAVINFDEGSDDYGKVLRTIPIPVPGNTNNESHHCQLSADKNVLACGGLLSLSDVG